MLLACIRRVLLLFDQIGVQQLIDLSLETAAYVVGLIYQPCKLDKLCVESLSSFLGAYTVLNAPQTLVDSLQVNAQWSGRDTPIQHLQFASDMTERLMVGNTLQLNLQDRNLVD